MGDSKTVSTNFTFLLFILIVFLALLQTFKTELWNDEAYYWVFSENLDWGYLDHPPMTALFIKLGTMLFGKNEFGVRFFFILSFLGSVFVIYWLTEKKDFGLLMMIILSLTALNIGGILAVPDNPLILFSGLFFITLKNYLKKDTFINAIKITLIISCLLYSKYHSILLIVIAVFSFPKILKRKSFYSILVFSVLLLSPHIYWQIQNDYPSVQYHFFERSMSSYKITYTLNYIVAQLFITGPLIGWMFFYIIYKQKNNLLEFEVYLKNVFFIFFIFFFAMSFKGKTEANWTAPAMVPAIILFNDYIKNYSQQYKIFKILFLPTLILLILIKTQMCFSYITPLKSLRSEWTGNKTWASLIYSKAKNTPVVFLNSYQKPSQYMFYSNGISSSYNNVEGRRNQYEYWYYNEKFRGRTVLFIPGWRDNSWDSILADNSDNIFFKKVENYNSFLRFYLTPSKKNIFGKANEIIEVQLNYKNYNSILPWEVKDKTQFFYLSYQLFKENKLIYSKEEKNPIEEKEKFKLQVKLPSESGKYYIRYSLSNNNYYPSINSKAYTIVVN